MPSVHLGLLKFLQGLTKMSCSQKQNRTDEKTNMDPALTLAGKIKEENPYTFISIFLYEVEMKLK